MKRQLVDLFSRLTAPLLSPGPGPATASAGETPGILVVKPDHLGDVVLTTPALNLIKCSLPGTEIHYLAKDGVKEILRGHPAVNELVSFNPPWCCRPWERADSWMEVLRTARRLAHLGFHGVLSLQDSPATAFFVALTGLPTRVGRAPRGGGAFFSRCLGPAQADRHVVDVHLDLARALLRELDVPAPGSRTSPGGAESPPGRQAPGPGAEPPAAPDIVVSTEERSWARRMLAERLEIVGDFALFHIGAAGSAKAAPAEKSLQIVTALLRRLRMPLILLAGPADGARLAQISSVAGTASPLHGSPCRNNTRATVALPSLSDLDTRQLAAVIAEARIFVGFDSGPSHVSWAAGTRTVTVFGPGNPQRWAPRGPGTALVRACACPSPCTGLPRHARCANFDALDPDDVAQAAMKLLEAPVQQGP